MAILPNSPLSERIAHVDALYEKAQLGAAAETVMRALDPIVERRLGQLLDKLQQCPPDLGPLLNVRAELAETWRIRKELKKATLEGKSADQVIRGIFEEHQQTVRNPDTKP